MSDGIKSWDKIGNKPVGCGSFGEVWKVRTDQGLELAAKYIDLSTVEKLKKLKLDKEVEILKSLKHRNIVRFVTAKEQGSKLIVFTEFVKGSDLSALGRLAEPKAVGILRQICEGLLYLHTHEPEPVLHRDLKGENIMVTADDTVKIIDFGLSIKLMMDSGMQATDVLMTCTRCCGTLPFIAPEVFAKPHHFSVKSDVWALGITLYQMMTGGAPFMGMSSTTIVDSITGSGAPLMPSGCSEQLVDFYSRCTAHDPQNRPPVRSLLKHAIF